MAINYKHLEIINIWNITTVYGKDVFTDVSMEEFSNIIRKLITIKSFSSNYFQKVTLDSLK